MTKKHPTPFNSWLEGLSPLKFREKFGKLFMRKVFTLCSLVLTGIFFVSISSFAQQPGTQGGHELKVSRPTGATPSAETKTSKKADGMVATWTRDTSNPKLGEAWRDPSEMIWGDIVKREDGSPHFMNHKDATNYCKSIGAKLPSREDFIRLREYMGARSESSGYTPQVLPNLTYTEGRETLGHYFWSSSVHPDDYNYAYYFKSRHGVIGNDHRCYVLYVNSVRCVVARR